MRIEIELPVELEHYFAYIPPELYNAVVVQAIQVSLEKHTDELVRPSLSLDDVISVLGATLQISVPNTDSKNIIVRQDTPVAECDNAFTTESITYPMSQDSVITESSIVEYSEDSAIEDEEDDDIWK